MPGPEVIAVDGKLHLVSAQKLRRGLRFERLLCAGVAGRDNETKAGRGEVNGDNVNDERTRRLAHFAAINDASKQRSRRILRLRGRARVESPSEPRAE